MAINDKDSAYADRALAHALSAHDKASIAYEEAIAAEDEEDPGEGARATVCRLILEIRVAQLAGAAVTALATRAGMSTSAEVRELRAIVVGSGYGPQTIERLVEWAKEDRGLTA